VGGWEVGESKDFGRMAAYSWHMATHGVAAGGGCARVEGLDNFKCPPSQVSTDKCPPSLLCSPWPR
jgi:hypothetical protein